MATPRTKPVQPTAEEVGSPWLTAPQTAAYTRKGLATVNVALRDGSLKGYQSRPRAEWRVHREDADAWIKGEVAEVEIPRRARKSA